MKPAVNAVLPRVVVRAMSDRITVAVSSGSALCALITGSWPMVGVATLVSAVTVAAVAWRKRVWDTVVTEIRQIPPPFPCDSELQDEDSRSLLARLVAAQIERAAVLERHVPPLADKLTQLLSTAAALEESVVPLLRRHDALRRYLAPRTSKAVPDKVTAPISEASDHRGDRKMPHLQGLKQEVHRDIAQRVDLLRTDILTIVGTLELLPGRLVRLGLESTMPATIEAETHCAQLLDEMSVLERFWVAVPADDDPVSLPPAPDTTARLLNAGERSPARSLLEGAARRATAPELACPAHRE